MNLLEADIHPFTLPPDALRKVGTLQPFPMRIFGINMVSMQVEVWCMGCKNPGHGYALGISFNTQIDSRHFKTGSPFCWKEGAFQVSGGFDIWYGRKGTEIV